MRFEYKIVPAPSKSLQNKGLKSAEDRFAYTLEELLNELAAEGWEYQRAETLPSLERAGLTSTTTEWRNVLVFRRSAMATTQQDDTEHLPPPAASATPALAAAIEGDDTALQADAPASITPDEETPAQDAPTKVATPPAFLSSSPAGVSPAAPTADKTDDDKSKP